MRNILNDVPDSIGNLHNLKHLTLSYGDGKKLDFKIYNLYT